MSDNLDRVHGEGSGSEVKAYEELRASFDLMRMVDEIHRLGYFIDTSEIRAITGLTATHISRLGPVVRWRNWLFERAGRQGRSIMWRVGRSDHIPDVDGGEEDGPDVGGGI